MTRNVVFTVGLIIRLGYQLLYGAHLVVGMIIFVSLLGEIEMAVQLGGTEISRFLCWIDEQILYDVEYLETHPDSLFSLENLVALHRIRILLTPYFKFGGDQEYHDYMVKQRKEQKPILEA